MATRTTARCCEDSAHGSTMRFLYPRSRLLVTEMRNLSVDSCGKKYGPFRRRERSPPNRSLDGTLLKERAIVGPVHSPIYEDDWEN